MSDRDCSDECLRCEVTPVLHSSQFQFRSNIAVLRGSQLWCLTRCVTYGVVIHPFLHCVDCLVGRG